MDRRLPAFFLARCRDGLRAGGSRWRYRADNVRASRATHKQPTFTTVTFFEFSARGFAMTLTSYLMEELQPPMRIPSVEPREGWVAASSPMQGAGGVSAVGVLRTLKNGRRRVDRALGQESCYLGSALRLEAGLCCRGGRVSDFPQSRTT